MWSQHGEWEEAWVKEHCFTQITDDVKVEWNEPVQGSKLWCFHSFDLIIELWIWNNSSSKYYFQSILGSCDSSHFQECQVHPLSVSCTKNNMQNVSLERFIYLLACVKVFYNCQFTLWHWKGCPVCSNWQFYWL